MEVECRPHVARDDDSGQCAKCGDIIMPDIDIEELKKLVDAADDDRHVLKLEEGGWSLEHPTGCLPALMECEVHATAETGEALDGLPYGRYYVRLDEDDFLVQAGEAPEVTPMTELKRLAPRLAARVVADAALLREVREALEAAHNLLEALASCQLVGHEEGVSELHCADCAQYAACVSDIRPFVAGQRAKLEATK